MIALRYDTEYFDLDDNVSISLEADSPAFVTDAIPGLKVYKFDLPASRQNRALLNYADQISRRSGFRVLDNVHLELLGLHFRKGKLQLEQASPKSYTVSFISDTGDVAAMLKETRLRQLAMGMENVSTNSNTGSYPVRNYCLATVKNPLFYGDANQDFSGYVNYFDNNAFQTNTTTNQHCLSPFIFVRSVLDAIAALIGYRLKGAWLEKINHLCIYSNRALDQLDANGLNVYQSTFSLASQLPDISAGAFLQALRSLFGLMINFDSNLQQIEVVPFTDLVSDTNYRNMDHAAVAFQANIPYELDGFRLSMGTDNSDELYKRKTLRSSYYEQAGAELKISSAAGTLYPLTEEDPRNPGQLWSISQAEQPGTSEPFELENEAQLRLLWYLGKPGDYHQVSYAGGPYELSYSQYDNNNLYETAWSKWIGHITQPSVQTNLNLNLTDLLTLNFKQKLMIKNTAYLLEKYSLPVSRKGLGSARVRLRKVKF
jgi:hypothetical protein